MDNNFNQQPVYQQVPNKPSNTNIMELIALICSGVGAVMAILGATLTCSCSASKTYDMTSAMGRDSMYSMSAVFIVTIFGVLFAIGGARCW